MAALSQSDGPHPGCVILTAEGDLDVTNRQEFDATLAAACQRNTQLILDMSAVSFIDTSALAVIVSNWKRLTSAGGTLALAGARYRHTKSLWITGLAQRLPCYDTLTEASAAMTAGGPPNGSS